LGYIARDFALDIYNNMDVEEALTNAIDAIQAYDYEAKYPEPLPYPPLR
jgi:hypothetical protein